MVNHLKFLWSCHPLRISITSDMGFQCWPNKTEKPDHILNRKTFLRCIYLNREIDKRVLDSRFSRKRDAIRFGTSILALSRVRTLVRAGLWASYPPRTLEVYVVSPTGNFLLTLKLFFWTLLPFDFYCLVLGFNLFLLLFIVLKVFSK